MKARRSRTGVWTAVFCVAVVIWLFNRQRQGHLRVLSQLDELEQSSASRWPAVQFPSLKLPDDADIHRQKVKDIFLESYQLYREIAFGSDEVRPLTQKATNSRNGWGASIVDAMGTMHIMQITDFFEEAVEFATQIDFSSSRTRGTVSLFESTIRYIGGLLSAYQLSGDRYPALVLKAQELADKLAFGWVDDNVVPFNQVWFVIDQPVMEPTTIADAGSLTMEWGLLSEYTGNRTYRDLAEGAVIAIANHPTKIPGLASQTITPDKMDQPSFDYITWGASSDSYFEYLIKYPRLLETDLNIFVDTWKQAVDSSITHLVKVSPPLNWTFMGEMEEGVFNAQSSHLQCFHGGNWILGGRLLQNETIFQKGLDLTDGCMHTYNSSKSGIGPESWTFLTEEEFQVNPYYAKSLRSDPTNRGWIVLDPRYLLRPEVLESNFYAWRTTGDMKYYDNAVNAVRAFQKYLKLHGKRGYAGMQNVDYVTVAYHPDMMESFWFAEVLKYLYLTFDDPSHISLDEWVFNTEGHPLRPHKFNAESQIKPSRFWGRF